MLRVDLPKCQAHKVTAPNLPRSLVPYRQSSLCVRAGIVARHALIAQRGPLARPALHYAYATRRSTRAKHASTATASASTSQDLDVSLPAAAESPSPQRVFFFLEAQQTRPAAVASYLCLHICRADTGVISNPPAPRKAPQTAWNLDRSSAFDALFPLTRSWCRSPPLARER